MTFNQFEAQVQNDPHIRELLQDVAEGVSHETLQVKSDQYLSVSGIDILLVIAAYALYRWAKEYLDHRRDQKETEIIEQQARIISELVKEGFPQKESREIVTNLADRMAKRSTKDPALQAVLKLAGN